VQSSNVLHLFKIKFLMFSTFYRAYERWKQEQGLIDQSPVRRDVAFPTAEKTVRI